MRTDLIQDALQMALVLRGERPPSVIFHSDRGTQGRFNRSSQHRLIRLIVGARSRPLWVFSSQGFCVVGC